MFSKKIYLCAFLNDACPYKEIIVRSVKKVKDNYVVKGGYEWSPVEHKNDITIILFKKGITNKGWLQWFPKSKSMQEYFINGNEAKYENT